MRRDLYIIYIKITFKHRLRQAVQTTLNYIKTKCMSKKNTNLFEILVMDQINFYRVIESKNLLTYSNIKKS